LNTNTNRKELQQLARYFYNITNTLISIYDEKEHLICTYPETMCAFCTEVRKNSELARSCIQNDEAAFEVCKTTRRTHIYHCHMGLLEVATPIICNHVIIGYMLFGQITDEQDREKLLSGIEGAIQQYELDKTLMRRCLKQVEYHTKEYIESIARLLEMCANYIWLNSIISIRREGLAFSIDLYLREHLADSLEISQLCRHFGIGHSTLYELSVNNFGCGINEYIQRLRNDAARELLRTGGLSVAEVGEAVGIKDPNYFVRFFKKHNGCTPKVWQKEQEDRPIRE